MRIRNFGIPGREYSTFLREADKGSGTGGSDPATTEAKTDPATTQTKTTTEPKISDSEAELVREVMQKKEKLNQTTEQLKQANDRLAAYEGVDPEEYRKLKAAQADAERKELEAKGDWERLRQTMAEQHQKELEEVKTKSQKELEALQAQLANMNGTLQELTVGQSFATSSYIKEELVLTPLKARRVYGEHFEIEDGKVVAFDKPRGAKERTKLVDSRGMPLPFDDAIKRLVDADPDKEEMLRSKAKPGAGSETTTTKQPEVQQKLRGVSKIAAALAARK